MTDLITGMASGYTWTDLEPFAVSLQRSGFAGRCVLFTGQGPQDEVPRYGDLPPARQDRSLAQMLGRYGIELVDVGQFFEHPSIQRQIIVADYLQRREKEFRFVLCVDTKDVVFQYNPIEWMEKNVTPPREIIVVSEMQLYGDGPMVGNNSNMVDAFGWNYYNSMKGMFVANGGVFAGTTAAIEELTRANYALALMDERRETFIPSYKDMLPDQSSLNILIRNDLFKYRTMMTFPTDAFAFGHPLTRFSEFKNGEMINASTGKPYAIFHQYFDKPEWWQAVRSKYRA